MKIIMYGSPICSDCVNAEKQLMKYNHIQLDYRVITQDTTTLKEFLSYRDNDPLFDIIKEKGIIGIPFFILEDGTKTLDINDFINTKDL